MVRSNPSELMLSLGGAAMPAALRIIRSIAPPRFKSVSEAAATAHIGSVADRVRLVNQQLKQAHRRLDELCDQLLEEDDDSGLTSEQRDISILRSLPGIGRIVLATLLAEASQPFTARDYHALRMLTGVAPITKRSGKSCRVEMRHACNPRLRNAMYHWARVAVQRDPISRARGRSYARALRSVSDRLLCVACSMLRNRTLFDPQHSLNSRSVA